jgi:hypothetical protein
MRGSIAPVSIRPTVDCGTPARAASDRCDRPALVRAFLNNVLAFSTLIAYVLSGSLRTESEVRSADDDARV